MTRRVLLLTTVLTTLLLAAPAFAIDPARCMDCIEKQTQHTNPDGSVYYTSDGMCCHAPCNGYDGYEIDDENVGFGCLTCEVNNELVTGDICCSNDYDQNCQGTRDPDDTSGCNRDESGACPSWCNSCS